MFNKLYGPKNITKDWLDNPNKELLLNLDKHELTGMKVECDVDICRFLGKGDFMPHLSGYHYPQLGIWFDETDNKIDCFGICFTDTFDELPTKPFSGKIIFKGQVITLNHESTIDDLSKLVGEPYWLQEDD